MPQLDPSSFASQIFWLVVSFIVLYGLMAKLILPPILQIVEQREQARATDLAAAENLSKLAEKARIDYERQLVETRIRAQGLMEEEAARQKAQAEAASRKLESEIAAKLAAAEQAIAAKKQELMSAMSATTAELASLIVEKLTRRMPSESDIAQALKTSKPVGQS